MVDEDPYLWMEDLHDSRVREYIDRKNRVFREKFEDLASELYPRVLKLYEIPVLNQVRCSKRGIYALYRLRDRYVIYLINGSERSVVVDSKNLGKNVVIQWIKPSVDGDLLAFFYSSGTDVGVLEIIDMETMEIIDKLEGSVGDVTWIDRNTYYFTRFYRDSKTPDGVNAPAERVFLRIIDGREEMVFGAGLQSQNMISITESLNSDKIFVEVLYGWVKNWVYAGSIKDPSSWRLLIDPRDTLARPIDYVHGEYFVAVYDRNGLGRVIAIDENNSVREIVGEDPKYPLEEAVIHEDKLVLSYLIEASHRLKIFDLHGKLMGEISFDKPGTVTQLHSCRTNCIFIYRSFATPYRLYEIRGDKLMVLDDKTLDNVCVDELFIESSDKTPIHAFHIHRCGSKSGKAVLMGYGGFGLSLTPRFLDHMLVFIEDNGELFMANIRGGGEYGRKWHEVGRREGREIVYSDFLSIIKWLRMKGYRVVIRGSSNGGLLCGVIFTRYPEMIDGAVIGYPLLDMLRFHKLYIGKLWISEYGDPDDQRDREYLIKISPYHNLKRGVKYPPPLIHTGLNDDRVHPAHALKFSAKLDEFNIENYLRVETSSGHIGSSPEIAAKEASDILAYVYKVIGLTPSKPNE